MLTRHHQRAYTRPAPITPATSARLVRRPAPRRRPTSHHRTTDRRSTSPTTVYDNRCETPFATDPPSASHDPLSFSHPILSFACRSPPVRAREQRTYPPRLSFLRIFTRLLRHGSQRVGVAPSRVVPSPESSSSSFSLFESRDATCNLHANLSLLVTSAARYFISSLSLFPFLLKSVLQGCKAPQNWRKIDTYIHFSPHRKHRDFR